MQSMLVNLLVRNIELFYTYSVLAAAIASIAQDHANVVYSNQVCKG